jgi:hypothetical protein
MMNKIFIFLILSLPVFAQDSAEEALILNQELEFLQQAAESVSIYSAEKKIQSKAPDLKATRSLEEEYFGQRLDSDDVSTKASAPKKRSY